MWLSRTDYERLVTLAARCDVLVEALVKAEVRAAEAESTLAAERHRVDKLTVAVMDFGANKAGSAAISERMEPPPSTPKHPLGYTHEPDEVDLAKLEWYKQNCRAAGRDETEAVAFWQAEMRGESPPLLGSVDGEIEQ